MIGVVADDITGSNDIGIMFAKHNYLTHIYSYQEKGAFSRHHQGDPRVVILDTDSRFDTPEDAYQKVYQATLELKEAGVEQFFNKTCSVFRGNIGAEFDAMLDALEEDFAVVVLGFPKNGRTTVDGIHYVHGRKLEESEFKNDPMHPMTESNLVKILGGQTERKVASLNHQIVKKGPDYLREKVREMEDQCNYLILDVTSQEDLAIIARALKDNKVFCGSSALAEELPPVWGKDEVGQEKSGLPLNKNLGILVAAGSLMPQTAAQIDYFKALGKRVLELDTTRLMEEVEGKKEIERLISKLITEIKEGRDVLFHSSNQKEKVEETRRLGLEKGLDKKEVSRLVSGTIAGIVEKVVRETGQNRLLIAGGDTSAAVSERLGISGMRVWKEIKPGLPSCISLTEDPLLLVLKSGSFGKEDFFQLAIKHLQEE